MNQITDHLWLGSYTALSAKKQLAENNVTHVLSVVSPDMNEGFVIGSASDEKSLEDRVKNFTHLRINIDDVEDENIMQHFKQTNEFIDSAIRSGGSVLVHCMAGVSRSATCVCAYLMRQNFWQPLAALKYVKSKRPIANPNSSFLEQLEIYYQCGFDVSDDKPIYRQWKLKQMAQESGGIAPNPEYYSPAEQQSNNNLTGDKKCFQVLPILLTKLKLPRQQQQWENSRLVVDDRELPLDAPAPLDSPTLRIRFLNQETDRPDITVPTSLLTSDQVSDLRCKKCRQMIATSHQFILHKPLSTSGTAQITRNGMSAASSLDPQCTSYFIEPVNWMRPELEQGLLEGKLGCPNSKCGAKLGAYHWQGAKCSCGCWVTPAIMIQRARVDESKRLVRAKA